MSGPVSKSFASKILDKRGHYIYLVRGVENGKDAWLYVRVDRHNKEMFEYGLKKDVIGGENSYFWKDSSYISK